jgi:hypothetical protein
MLMRWLILLKHVIQSGSEKSEEEHESSSQQGFAMLSQLDSLCKAATLRLSEISCLAITISRAQHNAFAICTRRQAKRSLQCNEMGGLWVTNHYE